MENRTEHTVQTEEQDVRNTPEKEIAAPKKRGHTKPILIVVLLALLALIGYRLFDALQPVESQEEAKINVKVTAAEKGTILTESLLTGRIQAADEVSVVPLAAGKITAVYVELGDYVSAGQTLFTIDDSQIASSYDQAEIGYKLAMDAMGLEPIFLLGMRLGEGSGCPLAFQVLRAACAIINDMATFEQAGIDDGYLEEIREGDKFTVEVEQ